MKKKSRLESTCEATSRLEEEDSVRDYVRPARKRFAAKKKRALEIIFETRLRPARKRFAVKARRALEIRLDLQGRDST